MSDQTNQSNPHTSHIDPEHMKDNPLTEALLELEKKLIQEQTRADDMTQAAQRALADLQNFKRRTEEERSRFAKIASADIVSAILPHLDNIHRAFQHSPEEGHAKEWADSVQKIITDLEKSLAEKGLEKIASTGQNFDPNFHEALLQGPGPKDQIIEELEPGYKLGDFVIKPAKVKVGNGEEAA